MAATHPIAQSASPPDGWLLGGPLAGIPKGVSEGPARQGATSRSHDWRPGRRARAAVESGEWRSLCCGMQGSGPLGEGVRGLDPSRRPAGP